MLLINVEDGNRPVIDLKKGISNYPNVDKLASTS